mgnify:CR=1 FL=1
MPRSVQGILSILAQRQGQVEDLEEQRRLREWKEGQVWPDFGRKVLGMGLGGLMQLGTDRLGEAWLPSKKAALAASEVGIEKTTAEIAAQKIMDDKRKLEIASLKDEAEIKRVMGGGGTPTYIDPTEQQRQQLALEMQKQMAAPIITEKTRMAPQQTGIYSRFGEKPSPAEIDTEINMGSGVMHLPAKEETYQETKPGKDLDLAEVMSLPSYQQKVKALRQMNPRWKYITGEAKRRLGKEETAAAHKAADTASRIAPMMRRSRIKARLPGDKGDFLSYFRGVQASNRNRGLTPLKFKSKEMQLAYESAMPEAHDARKNGITFVDDGGNVVKLPPGKKAMFHVINTAGKRKLHLLRADYTDSPGKLERQRAAAKAKMARVERKIKSKEKIANKRIKANEAKLKQEGLSEKDKLALKREIAADRTRLNEAKFALEVHKAEEGSERVITDEYGNTTVVRTKKTLSEEEGKELLKKSKAPAKAKPSTTAMSEEDIIAKTKNRLAALRKSGVEITNKLIGEVEAAVRAEK